MEKKFSVNNDLVYINCIETAEQLGFSIGNENITDGIIYFKTGVSFWSFGESVEVRLTVLNKTSTKVQVESVANALTTWGKNTENENKFLETLSQLLKKMK